MPQEVAFDLYDERWRDCWVAATSTARQRKKQVDMDIKQRVERLIEDHGPQTQKPLTLRVYGTMIKGFCVINNERARSLYFESERVVLMFARQPFTEDHKIRLPAAKRQRMEAALTLDLDLARVEACEAFDWTRAPLEQGALLQLGAGFSQEVLPSIELAESKMPQLLDPSACEVSHDQKDGWLPRFQETVEAKDQPERLEIADDCKIVAITEGKEVPNIELQEPPVGPGAAGGVDLETLAMQAAKRCRVDRSAFLRPGMVYGFDGNPTMATNDEKTESLSRPRLGAATYHEMMQLDAQPADRFAPSLRLLVDPDSSLYFEAGAVAFSELPQMQSLLSGAQHMHGDVPRDADIAMAEATAIDTILGDAVMEPAYFPEDDVKMGGYGNAEAQDDRTAEVGDMIRRSLRSSGNGVMSFDTIMRPGQAERTSAALTFAALLALASAGELAVKQAEPFGAIMLAEAGCI